MEDSGFVDSSETPQTLTPSSYLSWANLPIEEPNDFAMADEADSMLCDSDSRLVATGLMRSDSTDEYLMLVNAGGDGVNEGDSGVKFLKDDFFDGGNVMRTNEEIIGAGDFPFLYRSARLGDFCYRFRDLSQGEYLVDLHFAEIINTNGPKGMRVFNVYVQEDKVLSEFDIFSVVGANKPLQLVDLRVSVEEGRGISVRFEGVIGSPIISAIGIRSASNSSVTKVSHELLKCENCAAEMLIPPTQMKIMQKKSTAKYEKRIKELTDQCEIKANECYEAWMSLTSANEQLNKVRMELDDVSANNHSQDEAMRKQSEDLRNITNRYEHDKNRWTLAVNDLQEKIKVMKSEHIQLSCEAHDCTDLIPDFNKMVFAIQALVAQCEDLKMKYSEEQAQRKKLFNEVQDSKGNIRVFCRCRPLNKVEIASGCSTVVDFDVAKDGFLGVTTNASTKKSFKFDRVYTPKDDQVDVFADASPMVISVLDGYNVCIFAYGQTGTGKTFTMEGNEQNRGVNYRTLEKLFEVAKERSDTFTYEISVSVLEVYNEQIRDLLGGPTPSKKLEIKQQTSEGSHPVPGIVEAKVNNIGQVWSVLQAGSNARVTSSNNVNEHSSRSHCLLCIMVKAKNLMNGECTKSKLWLVDLAGSERLAKTDVQGERLKEAQNINKSLSALGDVISALANKSSHIPYRNSKLTHLLQDSLGGDSKTLMFVQISPSDQDSGETISSLNFATRVRGIELAPARKQVDTTELIKTKSMLEKARQEARSKDESLKKLEESLHSLENKAKGKDQTHKSQQDKIRELENQLETRASLHSQSEKQVSQLSDRLKGKDEMCCSLQYKVKELEVKLRDQHQSESLTFQQQMKDLESKLKDQVQEAEYQASMLHQKVRELETKLKEQEQHNHDSTLLHQKIKDLEEKLDTERQARRARDLAEAAIKSTPIEVKACIRDEPMIEVEPYILRCSDSVNRPVSQGSMRGNESVSVQGTRRKREFSRGGGDTENNYINSNTYKIRKSDPPKVTRVMRTTMTAAAKTVVGSAKPMVGPKRVVTRDQAQVAGERDNKKKIWSR